MKVAELIAKLQGMPQDSIVVLQKDAEGNGYSPLSGVDPNSTYVAKEDMVYSPVDRAGGYGEGGVPCVVLYPL
jgi:hypothetical protein